VSSSAMNLAGWIRIIVFPCFLARSLAPRSVHRGSPCY
jgi:hypothetical protein